MGDFDLDFLDLEVLINISELDPPDIFLFLGELKAICCSFVAREANIETSFSFLSLLTTYVFSLSLALFLLIIELSLFLKFSRCFYIFANLSRSINI